MSQQVIAKIELENGKQITHYSSLRIRQFLFKHHEFKIVVPFEALEDEGEHFFNKAHEQICGKAISFSFDSEYDSDAKSKFSYSFKGIITEISLRNSGDLSNAFVIRGYSPTFLLEDAALKRTFSKLSLQDIFSKVLNDYPSNLLKKKLNANSKSSIKYIVQYNETNFEFLSRMAAEYGEWFYYDGQELLLGKGSSKEVDFMIDGIQSFDMSISLDPSKFKLSAYDYATDKDFSCDMSGKAVEGLSKFGKFALDESEKLFSNKSAMISEKPIFNQSELDEFGKLQRSVAASELIVFKGSGEVPDISVGTVINVKGSIPEKGGRSKESSFGKYMVTEITHEVDNSGNYSNYFEAVPESVNFPPPNTRVKHPVGQTELAKVIDNKDPDNLGRVKVAFFWPGDNKESDWIRVGTFYSGNSVAKGMFFVPEIDAQVFVDYELNHPEYPFVVTSLYPKRGGTRKIADKNTEKYIYTQAGNQIVMYDTDKENKIEITNENKKDTTISLEFKDDGVISIKTKGKVEIQADDSITIKAKNKISMEAKEIEIKASQSLKTDGGQETTVKGLEIKVEAGTNALLKGGAQAKVEAAITEVSASGILTVKGSLVKIN